MNTRERFIETMNFNPNVHSLKWEFGYWGETVENWYKCGLPMKNYSASHIPLSIPILNCIIIKNTLHWNIKKVQRCPVSTQI